jgi:uncharacterized protein YqfA (UPF0365 family)
VPLAIAAALRSGNIGVMDLYRLRNLDSDTKMRSSLAGPESASTPEQPS